MAAGADKEIAFSPPGSLGLVDAAARFLIRFDEADTATRPQDETRVSQDFDVHATPVSTVMPTRVPAALGWGRLFNGATMALAARDVDSGATLFTRDMSIQVVLSWDAVGQNAAGTPGTIISRGVGGSSAEFVGFGLRVDVVDPATFTGLVRWYWQTVAGVEKLQAGAQVVMPPGQFSMLTATRRWVSPTQVELAYYVGDQLLGAATSVDGSIGGGTTGLLQIGCRTTGGVNGAFLAGTMDELMLVDRELCIEEIEATWLRITRYQPYAVQLFKDSIDPGFPMSDRRDSEAQLDIRMIGTALGYAGAQIENLRANFLPLHAYGSTLEQWEKAVQVTPKPGATQSIDERRNRVLARFRQRRGVSIPGLGDALESVVDTDVSNLQYIAYSNRWLDSFDTTVNRVRWDPGVAGVSWNAGRARIAPGAGTFAILSTPRVEGWASISTSVSRSSEFKSYLGEHALAKLTLTTPQSGVEAGVFFSNRSTGDYILFGLRDAAGTFQLVTEVLSAGVSAGVTVVATVGGSPAAIWLHLYQEGTGWRAASSTTSRTTGYTIFGSFAGPGLMHWTGCYVRSTAGAIGAAVADFDDFELWTPNATRPMSAYVYRNSALGGAPDVEAAQSTIRAIKHGFTEAAFIESREFRCGTDPCGRVPFGPPL